MLYTITLKKDFYWSAGKRFNWDEKVPGIGIRMDILRPKSDIVIKSNYGEYHINSTEALVQINKYNSRMKVGRGVEVGVIPVSSFDKLK